MNDRTNWLLFLALGFMWGSSYLFIKLAVDDFGTFTLVALRLAVGAALLWIAVRIVGQELPRERRIYGHLVVMAVVNIVIPFVLITWAEQSVDSSIAAILTSAVPLFAIVIAPLFLHDEPIRVNGVAGLLIGFVGVVVLTSNELSLTNSDLTGEIALLGAALSYAVGAVYSRRNMRGVPPMIPAVFQVTFALIISGAIALVLERPWEATPGPGGRLLDPVAGHPRLRAGVPRRVPPVRELGRDPHDAGRLPDPGLGHHPRLPRPRRAHRRAAARRDGAGDRWHGARQQPVREAHDLRSDTAGRGDVADALAAGSEQQRAADDQGRSANPAADLASIRGLAHPDRTPRCREHRGRFAQRRNTRERGDAEGDEDAEVRRRASATHRLRPDARPPVRAGGGRRRRRPAPR